MPAVPTLAFNFLTQFDCRYIRLLGLSNRNSFFSLWGSSYQASICTYVTSVKGAMEYQVYV